MIIETSDRFGLDKEEITTKIEKKYNKEIYNNLEMRKMFLAMARDEVEKHRENTNFETYFTMEQLLKLYYEFLFLRVQPMKSMYEEANEPELYYYELGKEVLITELISTLTELNKRN